MGPDGIKPCRLPGVVVHTDREMGGEAVYGLPWDLPPPDEGPVCVLPRYLQATQAREKKEGGFDLFMNHDEAE